MSQMNLADLNSIAAAFREVVAALRVERYETPLNLEEESAKTLRSYDAGVEYSPRFRFPDISDGPYADLRAFSTSVARLDSPWLTPMKTTLEYLLRTVEDSEARDPGAITARTLSMYGPLSDDLLDSARTELSSATPTPMMNQDIDAHSAAVIIRSALESVGLSDWNALVDPHMSAIMDVSAERRRLRIRGDATFSRTSMARLLVHEVGCHVFRAASGMAQPLRLLGFGLGDYLPTEEGLACYQEELTGLSDPVDSRRLALRYVAAEMSLDSSLFTVYTELRRFTGHQQAFETAARAKRGFIDTSLSGCHLKDKVYLEGVSAVERHLRDRPADLTSLYVGKISLTMLPRVAEALECGLLSAPRFDHRLIGELLESLPAA